MPQDTAVDAVYAHHDIAEAAVRQVAEAGLDMRQLTIIGRGYHTEEQVIGLYSTGDRVKFWGSRGALWGGLWGLLFGGLMLAVPVVGPVMVLGSLAATGFTAIAGAVEGAVVVGGLGARGGALVSIGVPERSVLAYEQVLKADRFLVVANGSISDMEQVNVLLQTGGPTQIDLHADTIPALQRVA